MKNKRKSKKGKLETTTESIEGVLTVSEMNDLCPLTYNCKEPDCWDRFGKYKSCPRYKSSTPRVRCDDEEIHYK